MAGLRLIFPETLCELVEEYCVAPVYQRKGKSDKRIQSAVRCSAQWKRCMELVPLPFIQVRQFGHRFSKLHFCECTQMQFIYELQPLHCDPPNRVPDLYKMYRRLPDHTLIRDRDSSMFGIKSFDFWELPDNSIITFERFAYRLEYVSKDLRYLIHIKI
jgi:hypothetical protein